MSPVKRVTRSATRGFVNTPTSGRVGGNRLPPGYIFRTGPDGVDIIGLSISDYLLVPVKFRSHFFIDENTLRDTEDALALAFADEDLNLEEMIGVEGEGAVLYPIGTLRATLNRALRYFGLPPVLITFGPTWEDAGTWNDNAIWSES